MSILILLCTTADGAVHAALNLVQPYVIDIVRRETGRLGLGRASAILVEHYIRSQGLGLTYQGARKGCFLTNAALRGLGTPQAADTSGS